MGLCYCGGQLVIREVVPDEQLVVQLLVTEGEEEEGDSPL